MFFNIRFTSLFLILLLLLALVDILPQQTPQQGNEFPIGAFIGSSDTIKIRHNLDAWNSVDSSGMNTFVQYADNFTQNRLQYYNLIAQNNNIYYPPFDKIYYYALGYYSVWQAENPGDISRTGFVHNSGHQANWNGVDCWTNNTVAPAESLLYGPHYKQDKDWKDFGDRVGYIARYWIALDYDSLEANPNTEVCSLYVTERYTKVFNNTWTGPFVDLLAPVRVLKVSDFYGTGGNFKEFEINYSYPSKFEDKALEKVKPSPVDTVYSDVDDDNGVEFKLDFLGGNNHIRNIYADKIEVYDNRIWTSYINDPGGIATQIKNYALSFKNSGNWDNMKYWYATDEPRSIDNFLPMHIVDSILNSVQCPHLITEIYPPWQVRINGDTLMRKYVEIAKPRTLMIDTYPFGEDVDNIASFENLRNRLQVAHSVQPDFWYVGQGFGEQDPIDPDVWHVWRKPDSLELKASVMLALAHGIKGLMFWNYWTYPGYQPLCDCAVIHNGLVTDENQPQPTELWYEIRNNLAPRLKGNLGDRLLGLKYTGNYIDQNYDEGPPPSPENMSYSYLSLQHYGFHYHWHIGFLYDSIFTDNKYFLMCNLKTNATVESKFYVTNTTNFSNLCVRDFEQHPGRLDTTIQINAMLYDSIPAGEGYLYQASPVVKYGGKLYYPEIITDNIILYDDMTIENGVTLTVNGNYTCYGNIYLKGSAKIETTGNGHISMANGKAIILLQQATIRGSQDHYLTIDCASDSNAVVVNTPAGLTAEYCNFVDGRNAIKVFSGAGSININHCSFNGQTNSGVLFLGSLSATPKIKYSTFSNSSSAVWAIGVNGLVVFHNTFTDNVYDVKLNLVTNAQIVSNTMDNSSYTGQGVFLTSTSGYIRQNQISGHLNGIYLANSSPNIGGNNITDNARHGIYIGTGSVPDLRGYLVQIPCNNPPLYYALRGYNTIYENGLAGQNGIDNDGSEIYLAYASILMNTQCNDISDDRDPNPDYSVKNLIGGIFSSGGTLHIENQGWGYNPRYAIWERFGTLNVHYDPYFDLCPLIDSPIDCGYIVYANDRTIIDTLYPIAEQIDEKDNLDMQLISADTYYSNGDYASAEPIYTGIVNNYPSEQRAVKAYTQLFSLKKVTDSTGTNFSELRTLLESKMPLIADSVILKVVSQLAVLCQVGNSEYVPAINTFDEIAEENPGTDEALYAEIDALTTAIISYNQGGGMQKGLPGKYKANSEDDLLNKINSVMKDNFEANSSKKDIIPTEYSLYNNYPNPFNPTTIIRYDIPERTEVDLVVYDILGRRVKSLINNEFRNPGRYEVSFNAGSLASGVYIYKLTTKNNSQARKMLLVK